jgi:RNA polymerase-binding transcription factor DksA
MQKSQSLCHHQSSSCAGQPDQAARSLGSSQLFDPLDEDQIGEPFYKFQHLKRVDVPAAVQAFSQFKTALTRRMASEETDLFPSFEARIGKQAKSISESMRQEHEQIREILNEIEWKLSRSDFATEAEERALEAALIAHNHRETRVVYSALE